tara:strand:+ start:3927 stop:5216 length:1290 start_codon:yes stop_codon:yes gene_type:complete
MYYLFQLRRRVYLILIKIGCKFNLPFLTSIILILSFINPKNIFISRKFKRTYIVFFKSGGISDLEATFEGKVSKNRFYYFHREYFKTINSQFLNRNYSIKEFNNHFISYKNLNYFFFLKKVLKWLNFFLGEITFLSFNFAYSEEFYLREVCKEVKIDYLIMYKESIRTEGNVNYTFKKFYKNTVNVNNNIKKISVYNDDMKKYLYENKIFKKNQIVITGMPRSIYLQKNPNKNNNIITFFLISRKAGFPLFQKTKNKYLDNLNWNKLNKVIVESLVKVANLNKSIVIMIKGKAGSKFEPNTISMIKRLIKRRVKYNNIKIILGGSGHKFISKSFIVIGFNSTTIFEALINQVNVIVPYFKIYKKPKLKKFILKYPNSICVDNNKKLQSKILSCINDNKKFESNKHNFFVKKYLGDVKNAPRNMRKFLGN